MHLGEGDPCKRRRLQLRILLSVGLEPKCFVRFELAVSWEWHHFCYRFTSLPFPMLVVDTYQLLKAPNKHESSFKLLRI